MAPPDAQIAAATIGAVPAVTIVRVPIDIVQCFAHSSSEIRPHSTAKPAITSPAPTCSCGEPGIRNIVAPTRPLVVHMPADVRSASRPSSRESSSWSACMGIHESHRPRSVGLEGQRNSASNGA